MGKVLRQGTCMRKEDSPAFDSVLCGLAVLSTSHHTFLTQGVASGTLQMEIRGQDVRSSTDLG